MTKWIKFEEQKIPESYTGYVILYRKPLPDECGLPIVTSNPDYAKINAERHGHTHWAYVEIPVEEKDEG